MQELSEIKAIESKEEVKCKKEVECKVIESKKEVGSK